MAGPGSSVLHRSLIVAVVLALLTAVAGLVAYLTRDEPASTAERGAVPETRQSAPPAPAPVKAPKGGQVAAPVKTTDPVVFAKAVAKVLWSYDTRRLSQPEHVAGLKRWMTAEKKYADWASVADLVPDPVLWSRMGDQAQYATAVIGEGHFPQAFKTALAGDPGAITDAYIYAVTVTGRQSIAWTGSEKGTGAEARSSTLAVQCRPDQACRLAAVLPATAP
ncbi:hypothetical protein I3J09_16130 [Streptomyces clavuligerus]|uniref:hypothetical protein n=1 Tax=Streptomyces clavuligerus TaxID=1901 RepID=UPI0003154034|nr:hypothetical protein [Streptomyces clavuligerus]ANW19601.1 hypothetical protein BB341_15930 [Streptomyces clavuligerus]AXU14207.1 hypothetical protein D1794_16610 [Streptomyces clavuligerus]MBY6304205.1 hypothetical protein [Streptomyces clavuligerus]QCS06981.1 hypothetical protein CRV15_15965 [Streptomyces clavuligerus]QPJ96704.1 hypothetical protein GE265_12075 [Streptomyces clavuligerus]